MRSRWILVVGLVLILAIALVGVAGAKQGGGGKGQDPCKVYNNLYARHQHMADWKDCLVCHDGNRADEPDTLKGKFAHMGGGDCRSCHDGVKAPVLGCLREGFTRCTDCHPVKGGGNR